MKNFTLRSLYLTLLVALFSLPVAMNAQVNCIVTTIPGTPATITPTTTFQTVTTQSGRYYSFSATAGCTYTFSHCPADGGSVPAGTDPILTISDVNNIFQDDNDDGGCGNNGAKLVWTAPATGTYRIHHEKCCCSQVGASNFATMAYKVECPCIAGVASAAPTSLCAGGSTVLTLTGQSAGAGFQWQVSTDSVNYSNISGAITTPWTYGPLVAGSYWFRVIVNCTGVGNTVGSDTTIQNVKVVVNQLPTVIFPPQGTVMCCNSAPLTLNTATPTGGTYTGTGVSGNVFSPNGICNTTNTITYTYTDGNGCTNTATQPYTVNDTPAVTFAPFPNGYCINDQGIYPLFPMNLVTPTGGSFDDFTAQPFVVSNNIIPANGTVGTNWISYVYSNGTCSSQVNQSIQIYATPALNVTDPPDMCINTTPVQIQATPGGGTFTDNPFPTDITSGGLFTPNNAGTHQITYSYTDGNNCSANQSININVNNYPTILWQLGFPPLCENSANLNLNGYALPAGGTYGSTTGGITANMFNPTAQAQYSPKWIWYQVTQNGCTSIDSQQIVINPIPVITFNGPIPGLCVGGAPFDLAPYFTPAGGQFSGSTYVTTVGMFNPAVAGTYNLTYTVVNGTTGCSNSFAFQVVVSVSNATMPSGYIGNICSNGPLYLLNMGTTTIVGGTSVYSSPTVGAVTGTGPYYWNPQVSGADTFLLIYTVTSSGGCSASDTGAFLVLEGDLINFPPLADMCENDAAVLLQAAPAGGVFSGPGVSGSGPYFFNPGIGVGNYNIRYVYSNGTCADTVFQNVLVKPNPGNITISNIVNPTACGSSNGSFRINGLAPNTNYVLTYERNGLAQGPFSITSNNLGTYTVTGLNAANYSLITVTLGGCANLNANTNVSAILTDPNAPAAPTVGSNSPLCQFSTLQLTATSGVVNGSYTWTGPNSFFSNQQNPSIINVGVAASGTYYVTVTNNLNCTSLPAAVTVVVNSAPNLTASSNAPICAGNTLNLQAGSTTTGTTFQWTGPASFFSPVANPSIPNMTTANQGWYVVVATGPNLCTRRDSLLVNVGTVTPINPVAGSNSPVCSGTNLNLTATNSTTGATYVWGGPNGFSSALQNPVVPAVGLNDSGDYTVYATLNGCISAVSTVHVSVIQSLTPTISITATPDDTVCYNTNIDFVSVITDGGVNPQYQWYKNGVPVIGAIDSVWGSPYLTDLDTIYAVLINGTSCTTASSDTSNKITVHMAPNTIPFVTISSNPITYVSGQPMTFTANPLNAGTNPGFQWYLNGAILAGETNSTYTSSSLLVTDTLSVLVTSNAPCALPDTASDIWNAIVNLSVTVGGKVIEDMKLFPNPNNGTFILSGSFQGMTGVKDASIEVVNSVGQVVYKDKALVNNGKLDKQMKIQDIAAGVYIIKITADGQSSQMRFVVN